MSKETRRAARLARESRRVGGPAREAGAGAQPAGTVDGAAGSSPTRSGARPTSGVGARAGRRATARPAPAPSFFERYRTAIVSVAAVAVVAIVVGFVFIGSTAASYTCDTQFTPSPTPPLAPDSSARLGFHEDDMGNTHITSTPVNYTYCPPASGSHFNQPNVLGPIPPRLYKPDDKVGPPNWVHNLEHGALVVLYRNDGPGASAAGQQAFKDFASGFPASPICKVPNGVLSPVIARFDDMPHPFAVEVWDRVMYLDTWDPALATKFYLSESERVDPATGAFIAPPEPQCPAPSANPSAVPSAAPSDSAAPSATASPEPSAAPS